MEFNGKRAKRAGKYWINDCPRILDSFKMQYKIIVPHHTRTTKLYTSDCVLYLVMKALHDTRWAVVQNI